MIRTLIVGWLIASVTGFALMIFAAEISRVEDAVDKSFDSDEEEFKEARLEMNFQHIMHVDVFALVASLPERIALFDAVTLRQEIQPQHFNTRTIYLRGPFGASSENWFDDVEHQNYPAFSAWNECFMTVAMIGQKIGRPMAKAMLVELAPGGIVQWHKDEGAYADNHDRYHLPLVTNPGCIMYSGGAALHIPVGMLTYFNNHVPHCAVNFGTTPRYHLIADFRKAA